MSPSMATEQDLEQGVTFEPRLSSKMGEFSWEGVTVTVTNRKTKAPMRLLDNVSGHVKAGASTVTTIYRHWYLD